MKYFVFCFVLYIVKDTSDGIAVISRCSNASFGDYQCNSAMGIAKYLKSVIGYTG
jgi:arginyl-tRNA synthetase